MEFSELLPLIINDNKLHARWLNTLSLMENAGARKISACEDPDSRQSGFHLGVWVPNYV